MSVFLFILTLITMLAVVAVLGMGIFSLTRGEDFRARWSNKLMRWRVMLQAIAIVLILVLAWAWRNGH